MKPNKCSACPNTSLVQKEDIISYRLKGNGKLVTIRFQVYLCSTCQSVHLTQDDQTESPVLQK